MSKQISEGKKFNQLSRESHRIFYEAASALGLSDSACDILYSIQVLGEGCLQKDICENAYINKQTVSSSVRQLESKGYIKLVAGSGREKKLYLTDAGKKLSEETVGRMIEVENAAWEQLSCDERKTLLSLLEKWNHALSEKFKHLGEKS